MPCKGSAEAYVTIRNYPGESVVITNSYRGSEAAALQIDSRAQYFILEGLEICNVHSRNAYGIVCWGEGQRGVIIRNCNIHNIETTSKNPETDGDAGANAILLFGENKAAITDFAIVDNLCSDNKNGWSENISVTGNCENIYVVGNRVEGNTNIGIDFYGNAGYCGTPSLDQPRFCLAAGNTVADSYCSYADCAGLYVDGARDVILQYNLIYGCQFGIEVGSEERQDDYPVKNITVRYNTCRENLLAGIRVGGYERQKTGVVKDVLVYGNVFYKNSINSPDSAEIILAKCEGIEFKDNGIYAGVNAFLVRTEFGLEYVKGVTFSGNLLGAEGAPEGELKFFMYGDEVTGPAAFDLLSGGNNKFVNGL